MGWPRTSGASGAAAAVSVSPRHSPKISSRGIGGLRSGLAALALMLAAPAAALAADMPDFLRGSYTPTFARWDGFYFGGQAGASSASGDFGNANQSSLNYILSNTELQDKVSGWTTLPKGSTSGGSYGAFMGYNWQWNDVVMGGELNYNHMALKNGAQDSIGPLIVPGANMPDGSTVFYTVTVASTASVTIHDIVTARARAGWTFDRFLPYGFAGLAVGRADVSRSTTLAGSTKTVTPPPTTDVFGVTTPGIPVTGTLILPRDPQVIAQEGVIAYGFTAGLGVDIAISNNLFARAEWEFIEFPNISDMRVSVNSARAAIGMKF